MRMVPEIQPASSLTIASGSSSDLGLRRELNEDALLVGYPMYVVADGMGGHAAGEVASAMAIEALSTLVGRADVGVDELLAVVDDANSAIVERSGADSQAAGMGTTVTGLCLGSVGGSPHWFVFNVGDSRVYRIGEDGATQLTVDHSEVSELLAAGRISVSQAALHPLRNVVTRSLGSAPAPVTDVWVVPAGAGDVFVVCSDGLTNELPDAAIATLVVQNAGSPQAAADALVMHALRAGGRDNVSVIVVAATAGGMDDTSAITAPRRRSGDAAHD